MSNCGSEHQAAGRQRQQRQAWAASAGQAMAATIAGGSGISGSNRISSGTAWQRRTAAATYQWQHRAGGHGMAAGDGMAYVAGM